MRGTLHDSTSKDEKGRAADDSPSSMMITKIKNAKDCEPRVADDEERVKKRRRGGVEMFSKAS